MEEDSFLVKYTQQSEINEDENFGEFNDYKPKFKGQNEDYIPITLNDVMIKIAMMIFVLALSSGIWIGFVYFSIRYPITYAYLMFAVLIIYVVSLLFLILFGSFKRKKIENKLLNTKIEQNNLLKKEKQKIEEKNKTLKELLKKK